MLWIAGLLIAFAVLIQGSVVWAEEKVNPDKQANQACQEQLLTTKVKAQNLDEQRDRVTQEKSQLQVQLYRAQQEIQVLKKEIEDAKAKP
jgi:predicted RNase H-like nuclease (RuvC/YqgF family)